MNTNQPRLEPDEKLALLRERHSENFTQLNIAISRTEGKITTMSSVEIAKLTNKNHAHVLRDIRNILEEAGIGQSKFGGSYLSPQNKELPCYNLPKRECYLIVSGYSVKYRLAIIDRWTELEANIATPIRKIHPDRQTERVLRSDSVNLEWDARIHTHTRAKNVDGSYQFRRNYDRALVNVVIREQAQVGTAKFFVSYSPPITLDDDKLKELLRTGLLNGDITISQAGALAALL
jgi:phage regulator Rha-like protein